MKKEKLILSVVAVLFGLLVAGFAFYLFQTTKTVPDTNTKTISFASPAPTISPSISLVLDRPKDEEVVDSNVLIVSGKTQSNAVVVVITDSSEDVITPSATGNFSTTVNLDNGQNILEVISIAPNGESVTSKKTVTYSQEEF
ncbi:MAG: hypothetical protein A3B47_02970 [Candidatus Levybacteria bacterium RIFCSPLOWO2_01_FULL_39_24]|nr:MAG: hypothetical protein A2800_02260 [Candidatus Levybacteria bacterium RIFCSPHIGHO2_01_FULL_40_16]OGH28124.1 MAG: hypothetical protein A3E12_03700 [Candidatus Levybacteria bacterium RIFCSPHIGHO2_12_FULL_39_9]OGH46581.1 MAG: hypothetical protein A3B47_02970 [Candidatus Levybacteria bacterium RIFCSPLOWO2_01_FULL_39_24]